MVTDVVTERFICHHKTNIFHHKTNFFHHKTNFFYHKTKETSQPFLLIAESSVQQTAEQSFQKTTGHSCDTVVPQLVSRLFHNYGTAVTLTMEQSSHTLSHNQLM